MLSAEIGVKPPLDIVQKLDIKALPYVIFMIVPVLGRMSDSDDDIRSTATNTFASLVKMVPLEVSACVLYRNYRADLNV